MKDNLNYIDSLKMDQLQKMAFNFGYVNLSIKDSIILMSINENLFNSKYKHYYDLGNSYCKFETLKKILESSSNLEELKEYGKYRNIETVNHLEIKSKNSVSVNTSELIKQLKMDKFDDGLDNDYDDYDDDYDDMSGYENENENKYKLRGL